MAEIFHDIRVLFVHFNRLDKIGSAASAAAEHTKTLFKHHSGVDRNGVFADAENGYGSLGVDIVDDLIDGDLRAVSADTFEGVVKL